MFFRLVLGFCEIDTDDKNYDIYMVSKCWYHKDLI